LISNILQVINQEVLTIPNTEDVNKAKIEVGFLIIFLKMKLQISF
jgi:hypothetical protein